MTPVFSTPTITDDLVEKHDLRREDIAPLSGSKMDEYTSTIFFHCVAYLINEMIGFSASCTSAGILLLKN